MSTVGLSIRQIVDRLGGEIAGDESVVVHQVAPLERAGAREIGFVAHSKYRKGLEGTQAGALILPPALADAWAGPRIVVGDPYLYFARVSQLLNPEDRPRSGVHASAVVLSELPTSVSVGPQAYVAEGCDIAEDVVIGPGCVIERGVRIGKGTWLRANVFVNAGCEIGMRCLFHPGAVIGSDGFGIARRKDGSWEKIPQIGKVLIGDDVEVGANTTIDRGALDDTIIANGVKLDNLIQIGHNCQVGEHTAMAAFVGIAGSTKIGKRVLLGGQAGIAGHIEIGDDIVISAHSCVTKSTTEKGVYSSILMSQPHAEWLRNTVHMRHLDEMAKRIKQLEKKLATIDEQQDESDEMGNGK